MRTAQASHQCKLIITPYISIAYLGNSCGEDKIHCE